jgi:hypothetical protein
MIPGGSEVEKQHASLRDLLFLFQLNRQDPSWVRLKKKKPHSGLVAFSSDPAGIRTQDPYIKSVLLYQLSYGILLLCSPAAVGHASGLNFWLF